MLETILDKYRNDTGCKLLLDEIFYYLKADNFHFSDIINLTCEYYKITTIDLFKKDNHKKYVNRRKYLCYFAFCLGYSLDFISKEIGFERTGIHYLVEDMKFVTKNKSDVKTNNEYSEYEKSMLNSLRDKYDKIIDYDSFDN